MTAIQTLYPAIEAQMVFYREGLAPMPADYIEYHKDLATLSLQGLVAAHDLTIVSTSMESDGWCSGMKQLRAKVINRFGRHITLQWHDAHSKGSWFVEGAGWSLLSESDLYRQPDNKDQVMWAAGGIRRAS